MGAGSLFLIHDRSLGPLRLQPCNSATASSSPTCGIGSRGGSTSRRSCSSSGSAMPAPSSQPSCERPRRNGAPPITRIAEFITAVSLICGAMFVVIDLGRPDRFFNVYLHGRWQSPIMWDVMAITTYLVASILYLYTPDDPRPRPVPRSAQGQGREDPRVDLRNGGAGLARHPGPDEGSGARDHGADDHHHPHRRLRAHGGVVDLRHDPASWVEHEHLRCAVRSGAPFSRASPPW